MIELDIDHVIAKVTLSRPPVNAINEQWVDQFNTVLDKVETREAVSVLWLRSAQNTFCAGADLELMRSRFETADGRQLMIDFVERIQQLFERIEAMPLISVAEIDGPALGGGFELALACDFRVAAYEAKMGLPEVQLGLIPGAGGTQRLPRLCGSATARRLILGAEIIKGKEAKKLGVVHWAKARDELQVFMHSLMSRLSPLSKAALAECKSCIEAAPAENNDGFRLELEATHRLFANQETQKRVRAFLKRGA